MPALIALIACAGCEKPPPPAKPPPPLVKVMTISPTNVPIYTEWIGTLEGFVNAQIRAQVTGYLLQQEYVEGSEVAKGDLLFEIDPRPFQAALDQARAKLAQDQAQAVRTKLDVDRYKLLIKTSAISQQELDNAVAADLAAQAQVKADEAMVETANLNLGFTKITSPIEGLAGIAQAQIGDLVSLNANPLTTVSTIDPIKVFFPVSEQAYIAYRRQFTNATVRAAHEQELEFQLILADGSTYYRPGKFFFAGREVSQTTGTLLLTALFPNPDYILRPGQFARVRARTSIRNGALVVPQRAVAELQGSYQVLTVDSDNKVHLRNVTVGDRVGSDWVIEKGLESGDRVVVEGTQRNFKDGDMVTPEPFSVKTTASTQ